MTEIKAVPEGYRIYEMDGLFIPERRDTQRNMWRSFDKGRNGYYSYKSWNGALRFIQKKESAKRAREQQ